MMKIRKKKTFVPSFRFFRKTALTCLLVLASCIALAKATILETNKFADVEKTVSEKNKTYQSEQVLIVLDIDNTLLTTTSDLGGDIWYRWQRGKFKIKPSKEEKVPLLFEDTIRLLYDLVPMKLIEKNVPKLIQTWQSEGNTIFALTSRAPDVRSATEREMRRNGIDLTPTALKPKDDRHPKIFRGKVGRELSYMQGIMMTSGMNKGKMLKYVLNKTERSFNAIVFVDDSKKNVKNVAKEFNNPENGRVDLVAIHYTKVEDNRIKNNGTVLTKAQTDKMARDWKRLYDALNNIFPARKSMIYGVK